ncbi:hypothetical protein [Herbaspirillum autotrophicum]|uniref:hypothetical protein n=1 Tax=Herbaspirillum autotrophicum TaxID=180195 RepID=UPI00067D59CB|nr:hypothetical protein [Herbaspirillum autotrophicum]
MNITINEELRKYIDPLTENEYAALERSILDEGCRDALVVWNDVLIDGHNRYEICCKHGLEFKTVRNTRFTSIEEVFLWMIDNQLGRRSVTDFQRGMLALRKRDIMAARTREQAAAPADASAETPAPAAVFKTREDIAKVAGISSNTIGQIEKIQKTAAPELVEAVRSGTISINAAAAVASLPSTEQVVAVAGGKKELQQAAKMVRELKAATRTPRLPPVTIEIDDIDTGSDDAEVDVDGLRSRITMLNAAVNELRNENARLQRENIDLHAQLAAYRSNADAAT